MKLKNLNIIFQRINIVIFFIIVFSPCLVMIGGQKTVFSYTEKRLLAAFPSIPMDVSEVRRFFSDVDSYLDDHFGFREWMVYRYQKEIRKRFADVDTLTKVMKGTDGWYFYTGESQLEDYTGRNLLSKSDLKKWMETYRAKQQWLEKQDIRYLFIVPPNKMTVYGEFLGEPWLSQKGMTRLSQIKNTLEESDHASFLELSPSLIRQKDNEYLFFKSDTHWTEYGAYLGYLSIAEKIESMFEGSHFKRAFNFSETMTRTCEKKGKNCGDLTNMTLDYDSFSELFKIANEFSSCTDDQDYDYRLSGIDMNTLDPYIAKTCSTGTLKALVFRDSFFRAVEPYLSENFKEVIYLWKDYDPKNVEELISTFKPDIVIEERGERTL